MAQIDQIYSIHKDIVSLCGAGTVTALVSMSSFFLSYEFKDFERIDSTTEKSDLPNVFSKRRRFSRIILIISSILYIAAIALIGVSICLYRNEREIQSTSISGQIIQIRNAAASASFNQVAILASISAAIIIAGSVQCALNFDKREEFGIIGSSIYSAGWLAMAFAASMDNNSIDSINTNRLAWTLCSSAAIVLGSLGVQWQIDNQFVSGPFWSIVALGLTGFTIGTSYVKAAPNET